MEYEICIQCEGRGKRIFHKGTPRQYECDCPSCRNGKRKITGKIKKIVEEE